MAKQIGSLAEFQRDMLTAHDEWRAEKVAEAVALLSRHGLDNEPAQRLANAIADIFDPRHERREIEFKQGDAA